MADGVRIMAVDPVLRGALVEVPHPARNVGDMPKLYRMRLDGEGAVLVSEVVWARMREIMALDPTSPRFMEIGRTASPPTQILGGGNEDRPVYRHVIGVGAQNTGVNPTPKIQLK